MRIGFDAKRAFYNKSGLGNYSRSTIDLLAKFYPANDYFLFTPGTENRAEYKIPEKAKIISPKHFPLKIFKSYWRTFKTAKKAEKLNLDIYHGLSNELPYRIHKTGVRSIVTIHDLIFIRYPELYKPADRKIYTQKFRYACELADTVIAISEQTKSDIINFFDIEEEKISVVYQGCNPIFYKEVEAGERVNIIQEHGLPARYILNVGTVEKRKNALTIVKAVHKSRLDIPVVIIGGRTDYQEEIEDYIEKNDLEEQVYIFNNIPFPHFPAIYQQAELFVYPSLFEGFGIPIIEALNSKTPVITTKGGCFSEAGGFSSLYAEPDNVESLSEKIQKVLSDDKLKEKMIKEGYSYAANFSEDKIAKNMMNVYLS